jgi:hypothetical protein
MLEHVDPETERMEALEPSGGMNVVSRYFREIGRTPLLTHRQEVEIGWRSEQGRRERIRQIALRALAKLRQPGLGQPFSRN